MKTIDRTVEELIVPVMESKDKSDFFSILRNAWIHSLKEHEKAVREEERLALNIK